MTISRDMLAYYARRAREYERIYHRPALREEYATLFRWMREKLSGLDVLEVACGTGYWTRTLSEAARSIVATDVSEAVLEIARSKSYPRGNVRFDNVDCFRLGDADFNNAPFTGALAAFWWSHLPLDRRADFLCSLHRRIEPGATVVLADNHHIPGVSTPIARRDEAGNTYQVRSLDDGSTFEIVKNYPTRDELVTTLHTFSREVDYRSLKHFWFVSYNVL